MYLISTCVYKCSWRVRLMVCVCSVLCIRGPDVLRMYSEQHLTVSTHPLSTCTCCTAVRVQTNLSGLFLLCRIKVTVWGKNGPTDTIAGGGERCNTITSSFMMMTQSLITWNEHETNPFEWFLNGQAGAQFSIWKGLWFLSVMNVWVIHDTVCPVKYEIHKLMITSSKRPWSCIKCQSVISFLRMQEGLNVITARSVLAGGPATL